MGQTSLITDLIKYGLDLNDIFVGVKKEMLYGLNSKAKCMESYLSSKYIPYLEYHIADHCNLNCKACEHYSGLVKEPHFPDFRTFEKDIKRLKVLIDDIGVIRILGGEPLLNNEIEKYMDLTREIYPFSEIWVVTNGLRLLDMSASFFENIKRNEIKLMISPYPVLIGKTEKIHKKLRELGIAYSLDEVYKSFRMRQTLTPNDCPRETFLNCWQAHCNNLYEGRMAACFLPFTTKYFNPFFNKAIPEDGAIDLHDQTLSTEKLKKHLLTEFNRCRYCSQTFKNVAWDVSDRKGRLSDWVIDSDID